AGFALRHFLLRAAARLPPGGALRRARQGLADQFLDLLERENEFGSGLPLQIVAQGVVVAHVGLLFVAVLPRTEDRARVHVPLDDAVCTAIGTSSMAMSGVSSCQRTEPNGRSSIRRMRTGPGPICMSAAVFCTARSASVGRLRWRR